jgi:hypothetical protein
MRDGRVWPVPKVLLEWLNKYYDPLAASMSDVLTHRPNPANHPNFWDIVYSCLLRGKVSNAIRLLHEADFKYARNTARDGGSSSDIGFHGTQLGNIQRVINRLVQVLQHCPGTQHQDWNVISSDWVLFRLRAAQASEDLAAFAEGKDRGDDNLDDFGAHNFGLSKGTDMSFSMSIRKMESKVPWTIYQNLRTAYGILLGGATEVISAAQDWMEATIGLVVWWNDEAGRSRGHRVQTALPDSDSPAAEERAMYLQRIADALELATGDKTDDAFQINPMNPIEIGIASVLEGDVEGVILLLRAWSLPIASAVVEVASLAGWLTMSRPAALMAGFDQSDLMVLRSFGQHSTTTTLSRDDVLVDYAENLFERGILRADIPRQDQTGQVILEREGWEVGIQILGRLEDVERANEKVSKLLDCMELDSSSRVDKILRLCNNLGMTELAQKISEVRSFFFSVHNMN